jgi:hypothetical protein
MAITKLPALLIKNPASAGFFLVIPKQTGPTLDWSDHETMSSMRYFTGVPFRRWAMEVPKLPASL